MNIKILILSILALLVSCKGNKQNEQKIAAFKKQKHRFEFKGCNVYYNEQKVELDKPKSYYTKLFGDNYDEKRAHIHKDVPVLLNLRLNNKNIFNCKQIRIRFENRLKTDKFYNDTKHLPTLKEGEYILVDGVAFGHDVSLKELNDNLRSKGKHTFKRVFTYYSRVFSCKYAPLQAIIYRKEDKKLLFFGYEFEDSENKSNVK